MENLIYIENAKEILKKSAKENKWYSDEKYVKSAFGIVYLGILKSIDEFLIKNGIEKKNLPKSIDGYIKILKKYLLPYNGKLMKEFLILYDQIHIAGYYRGLLHDIKIVNDLIERGKEFIIKIEKLKKGGEKNEKK
ncbi:MAG: DUF5618 family protein [Candidatus Ratteibacteria bacterium]